MDLEPLPHNPLLKGAPGAFANAVALARTESEFRDKVMSFFVDQRFRPIGYDAVEPLENRQRNFAVPERILELARIASETGDVQFDTFFVYEQA